MLSDRHADLSHEVRRNTQFLDLAPGMYSVNGVSTGFRRQTVRTVSVLVDQIVSVDLNLAVGAVTEVVEVV